MSYGRQREGAEPKPRAFSGTNCRRDFVAAPCALAERPLAPIYTLRQSPRSPPRAMASPQTIPQVVEVDEARAPPSFGPRSRSIVLLLSAACLAAQS